MTAEHQAGGLDPLGERELAKIVEAIEIDVAEDIVASYAPETIERFDVVARRIGPALIFAMTHLDVPMLNRIIGLGLGRPVADEALDAIEGVYRNAKVRFLVQAPPIALTPKLHAWLERRAWKRTDKWANMIHSTDAPPPERTDLRIEEAGPESRDAFFGIVGSAFGMPPGTERPNHTSFRPARLAALPRLRRRPTSGGGIAPLPRRLRLPRLRRNARSLPWPGRPECHHGPADSRRRAAWLPVRRNRDGRGYTGAVEPLLPQHGPCRLPARLPAAKLRARPVVN